MQANQIRKNYLREPYARIVIPVEGGGYHAEVLEFPGCYAQGKTPEQAYRNLERAAASWISAVMKQGQQVPEPFSSVGFSGKIALRLPKSIHRQAARMAEKDRVSLNSFLLSAVSAKVGAEDLYNVMARRFERHLAQAAGAMMIALGRYVKTSATPTRIDTAIPPVQVQQVVQTANALPQLPEEVMANG